MPHCKPADTPLGVLNAVVVVFGALLGLPMVASGEETGGAAWGSIETADETGRSAVGPGIEFVVEDTGGFQEFRPRVVGRVTLAAAGPHSLRIVPTKIARSAACDVRQIRLVPVKL